MKTQKILTTLLVLLIVAVTAKVALGAAGGGAGDADLLQFSSVSINGKALATLETNPVAVKPLEELAVDFTLKNTFDEKITKITVQLLDGDAADGYQFNFAAKEEFHLSAGKEVSKSLKAKIPANTPAGEYTVVLEATGYTLDDQEVTTKETFTFEVQPEKAEVVLQLAELTEENKDKSKLTCYNDVTLNLAVVNTGTVEEDDIVVTVRDGTAVLWNSEDAGLTIKVKPGKSKSYAIPVTISGQGSHTLVTEAGYNYINNVPGSIAEAVSVVVTKEACLSDTFTPAESKLTVADGKTIVFSVAAKEAGFSESNIAWEINDEAVWTGKEFSHSFSQVGTYTVTASVNNDADDSISWQVVVVDLPVDLADFGVDKDSITDAGAEEGLVLQNAYGKIEFTGLVDLSDVVRLSDIVKIGSQLVGVDTSAAETSNWDTTATVTLYNVPAGKTLIYKYGSFGELSTLGTPVECTSCTIVSHENGTLVFEVAGFSTYTAVNEKPAELVVPSEIVLENPEDKASVSKSFSISNAGTVDTITAISFETADFAATYNAKVESSFVQLGPQEQKDATITIDFPTTESSGKIKIGNVIVKSSVGEKKVPVYIQVESLLTIEKVEINGKESGKLSLEEINDIEVFVKNKYSKDIEDVTVTVKILNVDGDDLEEESDEFDLEKNGGDDDVTLEFDLQGEDVDKEEYTLVVKVEGKATDSTFHETVFTKKVEVDRENHRVIISDVLLSPESYQCSIDGSVSVHVKNIGKSDEDEVKIRVKNTALNIDLVKEGINVEKFSDKDNDYRATFKLEVDDKIVPGEYEVTIEVFRDGELEETEQATLKVTECLSPQTASQSQNTFTKQDVLDGLHKQLAAREQASGASVVNASFRNSDTYMLLLGFLVVLVLVALVLAVAVAVKKQPKE